ncbi:MAG: hypothetical protein MK106_15020 [Mariniblastus sp.]|nr:hypothetical protein [Mariniblastus sp.]
MSVLLLSMMMSLTRSLVSFYGGPVMNALLSILATFALFQDVNDAQAKSRQDDLFGIQPKNQVEVFVASDLPQAVKDGVTDTLAMAVKTWGSTGRLEYWVLGADREAALELSKQFCERRVDRGDMTMRECMRDRFNDDHGFLSYQKIGAEAVATGRPSMSAGHNGGSEWGFHRYSSSLPPGFSGLFDTAAEGDQLTIFHEYWHSVQQASIKAEDHRTRRKQMGPVWFAEGSAVAMAEITTERLWSEGKLKKWNNAERPWPNLEQRMISKMRMVKEKRNDCKTVLPDTYEGECAQLAYESGGWAVAYLMNRHGGDVLLKSFHPRVAELGWEGAFQETFGQTSEAFVAEFETFVDLPLVEQVKILPQFK